MGEISDAWPFDGALQALVMSVPFPAVVKDGQGRWVLANETCLSLFLIDGVPYQGLTDAELAVHQPRMAEAFQLCSESDATVWQAGRPARGIATFHGVDGASHEIEVVKVPHHDGRGRRLGLVAVFRDVSANRICEAKYRSISRILNNSPAVAFVWRNQDGWPVEFVSENVDKLTGYTASEWLGGTVRYDEVVHPGDLARVTAEVIRHSEDTSCESFSHEPYRLITADGEVRWVQDVTTIHRHDDRSVHQYEGIVLDVTSREEMRAALERSGRLMARAEELVDLGSWEIDFSSGEVQWSEGIYRIYEVDPSQSTLTLGTIQSMVPSEDHVLIDQAERAVRAQQPFDIEHRVVMNDGRVKLLNARGEISYGAGGQPIGSVGTVLDITDRVRVERRLRELNEQLALSNAELRDLVREKVELMGIASHDLKNPLQVILGLCFVILQGDGEPERVRSMVGVIEEASTQMLEMVMRMLEHSRLSTAQSEQAFSSVDVHEVLEDLWSRYAGSASKKGIRLELDSVPGRVALADEGSLIQVLDNLISNALKFAPASSQVDLRSLHHHGRVRLEIEDDGPGLSTSDLEQIFERYTRASATPTAGEHSSGLGLYIARKLVTMMNGDIWAENRSRGAVFVVDLPVPARSGAGVEQRS